MKQNTIFAVLLILIAITAFSYQGISYKTREKTADFGPIQVTSEKTKTIPVPPIAGFIALTGAVILLVIGSKKSPL